MFSFLKRNVEEIDVNELDKLIGKINLIDIREPYELASGCIKTARNIPMGELLAKPEQFMQKDKKYYLICQSGARSSRSTAALRRAGYQVVNVRGGMNAYKGRNKIK